MPQFLNVATNFSVLDSNSDITCLRLLNILYIASDMIRVSYTVSNCLLHSLFSENLRPSSSCSYTQLYLNKLYPLWLHSAVFKQIIPAMVTLAIDL